MDRDILGLDPLSSLGLQSMNVLHYLGLKKDFKGIFLNSDLNQAINDLKPEVAAQYFSPVTGEQEVATDDVQPEETTDETDS